MKQNLQGLVIELCREGAERRLGAARLGELARSVDRERFLDFARRHGVLGLILAALGRPVLREALPIEAREEFARLLLLHRRRAGAWVAERDRILRLLHRAGLGPVMLKGGALCTALYADPVERDFFDLDLLVPGDQLGKSVAALLDAGYENPLSEAARRAYMEDHFHIGLKHPWGFVVEVHFGLTAPASALRLDAKDFLARAETRANGGIPDLRLPCPEHQILHVVSQNTQDSFNRLVRFVDIDRIIRAHPGLRWDLLEDSARRGGLLHALALSLQLTRKILETDIPEDVIRRIRPDRVTRFHLGIMRPVSSLLSAHFHESNAAGRVLTFWMHPGVRERVRYLHRVVTDRDDPLSWVWHEAGCSARRRGPAPIVFAKLAAYQCALYVAGLATSGGWRGRAQRRFWSP